MIKYQNATRGPNETVSIEVGELKGSILTVRAKNSTFSPAPGVKTDMVSGSIRLTAPVTMTQGGLVATVDESVEIRFNVRKGATASVTGLNTEAARVLGLALAQYNLALGLVPPSEATFAGTP